MSHFHLGIRYCISLGHQINKDCELFLPGCLNHPILFSHFIFLLSLTALLWLFLAPSSPSLMPSSSSTSTLDAWLPVFFSVWHQFVSFLFLNQIPLALQLIGSDSEGNFAMQVKVFFK